MCGKGTGVSRRSRKARTRALRRPAATTLGSIVAVAALAGVLLSTPASQAARASSGGTTHAAAARYVPGQIVIRFRAGVSPAAGQQLVARLGATTAKRFDFVPGLRLLRLRPGLTVQAAVASFAAAPEVMYAEPNWISRIIGAERPGPRASAAPDAVPNDPMYPQQWDWPKIGAPAAWDLTTGSKSVVVGDIDTGLDYNHEDLKANAWKNTAECNGANGVDDDGNGYVDDCQGIDTINGDSNPMDDNDHGTHTAGTIGAVGNNDTGVTGLNWKVQILPCKSHDSGGSGSVASIIECYQYMVTEKAAGYDIIATNNSYADCPEACGYDKATRDGINAMGKAGILFAVAAGNNGRDIDQQPIYPANYFLPNVIPVAATTSSDGLAGFSNYGVRVVMVGAPGAGVLSTVRNNGYASFSGTSMATPHVAGLAALIHASNPSLTIYQIRNLIISGGNDFASLDGTTLSGKSIDANGSLTCSDSHVFGLLQPLETIAPGETRIAALSIDCADPEEGSGWVKGLKVVIKPGNRTLRMKDDGKHADYVKGDGIFSVFWTPPGDGTYTLTFKRVHKSYTVVVAGAPNRAGHA
jgi:thermitase